jgi:hypothetical protein
VTIVRCRVYAAVGACVIGTWSIATGSTAASGPQAPAAVRRITWADAAPLQSRLDARGISPSGFPAFVDRTHAASLRRVHEGDLDHLVFYALQSTHFTKLAPIEPALSAKALVDGLTADEREAFLRDGRAPSSRIPPAAAARLAALIRILRSPTTDPRLVYFRDLVDRSFDRSTREAGLAREYLRAMRFVYEKEFVAAKAARPDEAVADLYRARGLSTDTEVEAGYLVYLGLGIVKSLDPERQVRRVLIVGPGLDLAPRTSLVETGPPESYQPWAVIDALLALKLSRIDDLVVTGADINSRVVDHLRQAAAAPPMLHMVSGVSETDGVTFTGDYRDYFAALGNAIGDVSDDRAVHASTGRLAKIIRVSPAAAGVLRAEPLDVVTERLEPGTFDVIIATNILPYFDDTQLMLALDNIAAMLAPGGLFLHNESRPLLGEITTALGLPYAQSRHAAIAAVRGAPAPLGDSVWIHRRVGR